MAINLDTWILDSLFIKNDVLISILSVIVFFVFFRYQDMRVLMGVQVETLWNTLGNAPTNIFPQEGDCRDYQEELPYFIVYHAHLRIICT